MVEYSIDNKYNFESAESAFAFMKLNIEKCFPEFVLVSSDFSLKINNNFSRFGFFYFVYKRINIEFKLECERGVLLHEVNINGKVYKLTSFDKRMTNVLACSEKNILFTLSVLKKFIESN